MKEEEKQIVTIELGRGNSQSKNEFFVDHNGGRFADKQSKSLNEERERAKSSFVSDLQL